MHCRPAWGSVGGSMVQDWGVEGCGVSLVIVEIMLIL